MTFKSIRELEIALDKAVDDTMYVAHYEAEKIVKDQVDIFYNEYIPKEYERTGQLEENLDSYYYTNGHDYYSYIGYKVSDFYYEEYVPFILYWSMLGDYPHGDCRLPEENTPIWKNAILRIDEKIPKLIDECLKHRLPVKKIK